ALELMRGPQVVAAPADPGAGWGPPAGCLGDFRILREIGRGGMGVVYEAEQVSLGRHVALKVLPLVAALDPRQLQRFQPEAQAAAGLHHTNIAPVHAVGCERGVHFYAMQYIQGASLAQFIAELRRLDGLDRAVEPTSRPRESASLAATLATALFAAPADPPIDPGATGAAGGRSGPEAAPPAARAGPGPPAPRRAGAPAAGSA